MKQDYKSPDNNKKASSPKKDGLKHKSPAPTQSSDKLIYDRRSSFFFELS